MVSSFLFTCIFIQLTNYRWLTIFIYINDGETVAHKPNDPWGLPLMIIWNHTAH